MYLNLLDRSHVAVFLGVAELLASVDGDIHAKERGLIDAVAQEIGEVPEPHDFDSPEAAAQALSELGLSVPAANVMVLELAGVALADGQLSEPERGVLHTLCIALDRPPIRLEQALEIAERSVGLELEAEQLIASE